MVAFARFMGQQRCLWVYEIYIKMRSDAGWKIYRSNNNKNFRTSNILPWFVTRFVVAEIVPFFLKSLYFGTNVGSDEEDLT